MSDKCLICSSTLKKTPDETPKGDFKEYECPRCGDYKLASSAISEIKGKYRSTLKSDVRACAGASYAIKNRHSESPITTYELPNLFNYQLPSLPDQFNNLILCIGNRSLPGKSINLFTNDILSHIGAIDSDSIHLLLKTMDGRGYLENFHIVVHDPYDLELSFYGWEYFIELQEGKHGGNKAFMAMKFDDEDLDRLVEDYIKPAVSQTGFTLKPLNENMEAGLIDSKLRVAIRTSKFIIADLTHNNNGAYWEAGYAEGLGIPVIYICEQEIFDERKTHFDTSHQLTIKWDKEKLIEFQADLKAVIRATLPEDAILEDKR